MDMTQPADELADLASAEVDELIAEHEGSDEPFSYQTFIDAVEQQLVKGSTGALDPPDGDYWRAVIAELHRRQDEAWRTAPDKSQVEAPWWVYSPDDFHAMLSHARGAFTEEAPWRRRLEREAARSY